MLKQVDKLILWRDQCLILLCLVKVSNFFHKEKFNNDQLRELGISLLVQLIQLIQFVMLIKLNFLLNIFQEQVTWVLWNSLKPIELVTIPQSCRQLNRYNICKIIFCYKTDPKRHSRLLKDRKTLSISERWTVYKCTIEAKLLRFKINTYTQHLSKSGTAIHSLIQVTLTKSLKNNKALFWIQKFRIHSFLKSKDQNRETFRNLFTPLNHFLNNWVNLLQSRECTQDKNKTSLLI